MSIINQTLKELDKRQQSAHRSQRSLPAYSAPARRWPLRFVSLIVAMLIGALLVVLFQRGLWSGTAVAEAEMQMQRTAPTQPQIVAVPVNEPGAETVTEAEAKEEPAAAPRPADDGVAQVLVPATQVVTRVQTDPEPASEPATEEETAQQSSGEMRIERVERDAPELARHKLEQARERLEQGQGRRAEQLLHEALVLQPGLTEARQQLAAYYYGRGFNSQAIRLLREGLAISPQDSRLLLLKARIYESSGRPDEALRVLRGADLRLARDADLLILRAALATDHADYELAVKSYQALVEWRPNHGSWWLGLALAYDQLGQSTTAITAYQRALQEGGLDEQSRQFIGQRLGVLH